MLQLGFLLVERGDFSAQARKLRVHALGSRSFLFQLVTQLAVVRQQPRFERRRIFFALVKGRFFLCQGIAQVGYCRFRRAPFLFGALLLCQVFRRGRFVAIDLVAQGGHLGARALRRSLVFCHRRAAAREVLLQGLDFAMQSQLDGAHGFLPFGQRALAPGHFVLQVCQLVFMGAAQTRHFLGAGLRQSIGGAFQCGGSLFERGDLRLRAAHAQRRGSRSALVLARAGWRA